MTDGPRRNVDGKVAFQGCVESRPFSGFRPAFVASIALAIVRAAVPGGRHESSRDPTEQDCGEYWQHYGRRTIV